MEKRQQLAEKQLSKTAQEQVNVVINEEYKDNDESLQVKLSRMDNKQ